MNDGLVQDAQAEKGESVTAGGYGSRDSESVVRLCSVAMCEGTGVTVVRLRAISRSTGDADETQCSAAQNDNTEFHRFPFNL